MHTRMEMKSNVDRERIGSYVRSCRIRIRIRFLGRDYTLDKRSECLMERKREKEKGRKIKGRRRAEGVFRGVAVPHDYREDRSARGESSKHQRGTRLARNCSRIHPADTSLPGWPLVATEHYIYIYMLYTNSCLYSEA